ncbi:MAG: PadR family transcriptional regulator [Bacteroidota bacterium]|nr:PadR family transcriptional regulator [Bacteroidota bacterium]
MSLPYVILGFLQYAPATGYDLKKTFDVTVRHFWPADQSHIYRALAELVERDAVRVEEIPQSGRPNRKLYHITERGRQELISWLRQPAAVSRVRNTALVHVFFAGNLKDADVLTLLEAYENGLREELACYRRIPDMLHDVAPFRPSKRESFFWMLTLEYGIVLVEAQLAWVRGVRKRIQAKQYVSTVEDLPEEGKAVREKKRRGR